MAGHSKWKQIKRAKGASDVKRGKLFSKHVRLIMTAARMGGGEFVVLYPGAPKATALRLAEALRKTVEAYPFPHRAHQPLGAVTLSGGVAAYPEDSRTGTTLLQAASEALFEAKADGRNRVLAASPSYLA